MKNTSKQQQDNRQSSINAIISEQRTFSGPLPHPEDLAKYDQIVPGAADRIIKMAENEMCHRHRNEDKLTNGMIWTTVLSMIFAFFIGLWSSEYKFTCRLSFLFETSESMKNFANAVLLL